MKGSNLWVIHMWGKENGPFLQFLHFSFGLGSFFAPLVVEPFLLPLELTDRINDQLRIDSNSTINGNFSSDPTVVAIRSTLPHSQLNLRYAYFIIGGFSTAVLASLILTLLYKPDNKPHPTREVQKTRMSGEGACEFNGSDMAKQANDQSISRSHKLMLVLLGMAFIHLVYGVELSFGNLLPIFAVKSALKFSKSRASYLTATYWACFTFFRILTVALVTVFSNKQMIAISMSIVTVANFILLPLANGNATAMWFGACLMGFGEFHSRAHFDLTPLKPTKVNKFTLNLRSYL
jgi:fucose permease